MCGKETERCKYRKVKCLASKQIDKINTVAKTTKGPAPGFQGSKRQHRADLNKKHSNVLLY